MRLGIEFLFFRDARDEVLTPLVGAGLVGMATKLVEPLFPNNTLLATAIILVAVIGFIQFRPRGLFAQKGRSAEL